MDPVSKFILVIFKRKEKVAWPKRCSVLFILVVTPDTVSEKDKVHTRCSSAGYKWIGEKHLHQQEHNGLKDWNRSTQWAYHGKTANENGHFLTKNKSESEFCL